MFPLRCRDGASERHSGVRGNCQTDISVREVSPHRINIRDTSRSRRGEVKRPQLAAPFISNPAKRPIAWPLRSILRQNVKLAKLHWTCSIRLAQRGCA
jgi:hypothetical protein